MSALAEPGTPDPVTLEVERLRGLLRAGRDPDVAAGQTAYLKGLVRFYGWKGPRVAALSRAEQTVTKGWAPAQRIDLGLRLLDSEWGEEQQLGLLILYRHRQSAPTDLTLRLEPIFDRRATNWATCDAICGRVLRHRLPQAADRARLLRWSESANTWRRRAACVAYVNEARKGLYAEEIRLVVPQALAIDERFVQLGAGWLLRERWLAAPDEVVAFLRAQGGEMRREALRYAIEKMPPEQREALLRETGPARRG